jgi:hypothetical protein
VTLGGTQPGSEVKRRERERRRRKNEKGRKR